MPTRSRSSNDENNLETIEVAIQLRSTAGRNATVEVHSKYDVVLGANNLLILRSDVRTSIY